MLGYGEWLSGPNLIAVLHDASITAEPVEVKKQVSKQSAIHPIGNNIKRCQIQKTRL